jgi:hypothetical protein
MSQLKAQQLNSIAGSLGSRVLSEAGPTHTTTTTTNGIKVSMHDPESVRHPANNAEPHTNGWTCLPLHGNALRL